MDVNRNNPLVCVFRTLNLSLDIIEYILERSLAYYNLQRFTHRRKPRATSSLCPPAAPCPPRTPPRRQSRPRASDRWTATKKRTPPTAAATWMTPMPLLQRRQYPTRPISDAAMTTVTSVRRRRSRIPLAASVETLRAPSRQCRSDSGKRSSGYYLSSVGRKPWYKQNCKPGQSFNRRSIFSALLLLLQILIYLPGLCLFRYHRLHRRRLSSIHARPPHCSHPPRPPVPSWPPSS